MASWVRGVELGKGTYGVVNLAVVNSCPDPQIPDIFAVKSAPYSKSSSLKKEREILGELEDCPEIIRCYGNQITVENLQIIYNLFLEYAYGGSLADTIKATSGRGLPISQVRHYSKSILHGLRHIHAKGYVHCDIKPNNILLHSSCSSSRVSIADFGLAKKVGMPVRCRSGLCGTLLYMAPESIAWKQYGPPLDVWAFGCVFVEMLTGRNAWNWPKHGNVNELQLRICSGKLPDIPEHLSKEGKDFFYRIFERDPITRWTADMLLNHPFLLNEVSTKEEAYFVAPARSGSSSCC